jgi:predicted extracellular nuclease
VHLKSQLEAEEADDPEGCPDEVRREQAEDIQGKLAEVTSDLGEQDIIIVGDFNATLDDASLNPILNGADFKALTSAGRWAGGSNTYSYVPQRFRSLIDHLMVKTSGTGEWVNRSTFVMNPPTNAVALKNYLEWFSDHLPVWSWFRTDRPDDD